MCRMGHFRLGRRNCLNCDSTAILTYAFHFYFAFCVSFLSRVDELNKLAGSQSMGLHSSVLRALQRERDSRLETPTERESEKWSRLSVDAQPSMSSV